MQLEALCDGEDFELELTRDTFDQVNSDLFAKCLAPVDRALSDAKLTAEQIDDVVLIGGSTRIVRIQSLLQQHFGGKVTMTRVRCL
jgi:molecular chaperone DnaK (HSP70)